MECDTNLSEHLVSYPDFFLSNPLKPKLVDGFSMESTSSNGLYPKFPNFEQLKSEGSSSNPFGVSTPFYDPFDPFQDSSVNRCLKDFPLYGSRPSTNNGANGIMHGFETTGFLNFPSETSLQTMDQDQIHQPLNFREFRSLNVNSRGGISCIAAERGHHKGADPKQTKTVPTKRKNNVHKRSIIVRGQWTREEDTLLVQLVEQHGVRKWSHIAQMLPGRVGKQCRERWHNHLRPDIKKDRWSEEEDKTLIEAHRQIGNRWAEIARRLPGRSENTVKNHWNATKRQLSSQESYNGKYYSLLQNYIKSVISTSADIDFREIFFSDSNLQVVDTMINQEHQQQGSDFEPKEKPVPNSEYNKATNFSSDPKRCPEAYSFRSMHDYKRSGSFVDESNLEFELPLELGTEMQFDNKEMDFFGDALLRDFLSS